MRNRPVDLFADLRDLVLHFATCGILGLAVSTERVRQPFPQLLVDAAS